MRRAREPRARRSTAHAVMWRGIADMNSAKFYLGFQVVGEGNAHRVSVMQAGGIKPLSARRSQAVFNHSPDGFAWGYGGSGPAQLALAILLDALDDTPRAL